MITINDLSRVEGDRLSRVLGETNFLKSKPEGDIYPKVSCGDNVSIAFNPRYDYAIIESELGQFDLFTKHFSTITIL